MGIQRASQMVQLVRDLFDEGRAANNRAGHDVGVAVEIFRAAVQRQIEPPLRGPEIHRTGKGVVDDGDQAVFPCKLHNGFEVRHLQQRVRDSLDIDGPRIGPEFFLPRSRVFPVYKIVADAE